MSKSSLMRLSRAYERGQLSKQTYRRRRTELITAVMKSDEDDETITDMRPREYPLAKPVDEMDIPQLKFPGSGRMNRLVIGGVGALVVVALGAWLLLSSGNKHAPAKTAAAALPAVTPTPATTQKSAPAPQPQPDVLRSYTEKILAKSEVTREEMENLKGVWNFSSDAEKAKWQAYADKRLRQAWDAGDHKTVKMLSGIFYELQLPPPIPEAARTRESVAGTNHAASSIAPTKAPPAEPRPAPIEPAATPSTTKQAPVAEKRSKNNPATGVAAATVRKAPVEHPASRPPTAPKKAQPVQKVAATGATPHEQQPAGRPPLHQGAVKPVTVQAAPAEQKVSVVEPTAAMLAEQEREQLHDTLTAKVTPALVALTHGTVSSEKLAHFVDVWHSGSVAEQKAFAITGDEPVSVPAGKCETPRLFECANAIVRLELSKYQYNNLPPDARYRLLGHTKEVLRRLVDFNRKVRSQGPPTSSTGQCGRGDLMRIDGSKYTLQLLGSTSEQGVRTFIHNHAAKVSHLYYVQMKRDGGNWYVVMQGEYTSKSDALLVFQGFPADVKAKVHAPWARTFQSIQDLVRTE